MRKGVFAFLGGILLLQWLPALPARGWVLLLPLMALLLGITGKPWRPLFLGGAGFLWVLWHVGSILASTLPPALEGRDLVVEGTVADIPRQMERGMRFQLAAERLIADGRPHAFSGRLRLSWYGRSRPVLHTGERWRLRVRLKRPHGFMNPGGFDYEGWLFRHGVRATGYVRQGVDNLRMALAPALHWGRLRQTLYEDIRHALDGHPFQGMVAALVVGERQGVTADQWKVLRNSGTGHLMAISGLHIGLVAGLAFFLVRRLWSLSSTLCLWLAAPRAGALGALTAAALYAALAGFTVPTLRALIMVAVAMAALLLQVRWRVSDALALALWCILLWDPLAVMDAGFWLSFAAVAVILYVMQGQGGRQGPWRRWGHLHGAVALGVAPLSLLFFHQQPLLAPVANLVAVPWVSLLVVPLVLAGALCLPWAPQAGQVLLEWGADLLAWLWPLLAHIAAWPWGQWQQAPTLWAATVAAAGLGLLLAPRGLPGRWLGILWLLPLFLYQPPPPAPGSVRFTLLDVGQGLAAVAQTRHHVLVYDTGPRYSPGFDAGAAVVVPFLRSQGIGRVDLLVIGHGDNDHMGGAKSLLHAMPVTRIISSVPARLPDAGPCLAGQAWRWDGVDFRILHPGRGSPLRGNDASCVLRIATRGPGILLSGDIERPAERSLLRQAREWLPARLLVAPHHGSRTSSSAAFLDAVAPDHVLFPVGYHNRYGLPATEVVARYRRRGIRLWDSAHHGALSVELDARGRLSLPHSYRKMAGRYWHGG